MHGLGEIKGGDGFEDWFLEKYEEVPEGTFLYDALEKAASGGSKLDLLSEISQLDCLSPLQGEIRRLVDLAVEVKNEKQRQAFKKEIYVFRKRFDEMFYTPKDGFASFEVAGTASISSTTKNTLSKVREVFRFMDEVDLSRYGEVETAGKSAHQLRLGQAAKRSGVKKKKKKKGGPSKKKAYFGQGSPEVVLVEKVVPIDSSIVEPEIEEENSVLESLVAMKRIGSEEVAVHSFISLEKPVSLDSSELLRQEGKDGNKKASQPKEVTVEEKENNSFLPTTVDGIIEAVGLEQEEKDLLHWCMSDPEEIFTRAEMAEGIDVKEYKVGGLLKSLNEKINTKYGKNIIYNVWGKGYVYSQVIWMDEGEVDPNDLFGSARKTRGVSSPRASVEKKKKVESPEELGLREFMESLNIKSFPSEFKSFLIKLARCYGEEESKAFSYEDMSNEESAKLVSMVSRHGARMNRCVKRITGGEGFILKNGKTYRFMSSSLGDGSESCLEAFNAFLDSVCDPEVVEEEEDAVLDDMEDEDVGGGVRLVGAEDLDVYPRNEYKEGVYAPAPKVGVLKKREFESEQPYEKVLDYVLSDLGFSRYRNYVVAMFEVLQADIGTVYDAGGYEKSSGGCPCLYDEEKFPNTNPYEVFGWLFSERRGKTSFLKTLNEEFERQSIPFLVSVPGAYKISLQVI